jgi:GTP pyrophosphokinase
MEEKFEFTQAELQLADQIKAHLRIATGSTLTPEEEALLESYIQKAVDEGCVHRDIFWLNPVLMALQTAQIAVDEIGIGRDGVIATLLYRSLMHHDEILEQTQKDFGEDVAHIIQGLIKIQKLYEKNPVIESENFRNLLLSFAEDMRVILIMIADRVNIMRQIRDTQNKEAQREVSEEASYLYAPLAHKLGLYTLKSELEIFLLNTWSLMPLYNQRHLNAPSVRVISISNSL